jgi:hypothetical protein
MKKMIIFLFLFSLGMISGCSNREPIVVAAEKPPTAPTQTAVSDGQISKITFIPFQVWDEDIQEGASAFQLVSSGREITLNVMLEGYIADRCDMFSKVTVYAPNGDKLVTKEMADNLKEKSADPTVIPFKNKPCREKLSITTKQAVSQALEKLGMQKI